MFVHGCWLKATERQEEKQIPEGNDRKKGNGNGSGKGRGNSFSLANKR